MSDTFAAYRAKNQERSLAHCPHASDVRGFHAWLKAGRVVRKGQTGIRIVAPSIDADGERLTSIRPVYVFDVTQTDPRTRDEAVMAYAAAD
jgi:hypothetical protein